MKNHEKLEQALKEAAKSLIPVLSEYAIGERSLSIINDLYQMHRISYEEYVTYLDRLKGEAKHRKDMDRLSAASTRNIDAFSAEGIAYGQAEAGKPDTTSKQFIVPYALLKIALPVGCKLCKLCYDDQHTGNRICVGQGKVIGTCDTLPPDFRPAGCPLITNYETVESSCS